MTTARLGATLTQLRKERIRIERQLAGVDDAIRAISGVVGSGWRTRDVHAGIRMRCAERLPKLRRRGGPG
jgi:hypothetical protein